MKKEFKITAQLNMNASHEIKVSIKASNKNNAIKLAEKAITKKYHPSFINIINVE